MAAEPSKLLGLTPDLIETLVRTARLPASADLVKFAAGVRAALSIYRDEKAAPTANSLHKEIAGVYAAAWNKRYAESATRIELLSDSARRDMLRIRAAALALASPKSMRRHARHLANGLPGAEERILEALIENIHEPDSGRAARRLADACIPRAEAFHDRELRERACEVLTSQAASGGAWTEGRARPTGKRSHTWKAILNAAPMQMRPARNEAERTLVMWLQIAWLEAAGVGPALTASHEKPGPFARFVKECLKLVGAKHIDAVHAINDLNRMRKKRPVRPKLLNDSPR